MTNTASPLGSPGRLPPEIKYMIYAHCHGSSKYPESTQMLAVNTTIYFEFLESFQRVGKWGLLRLHIDPSKHPSTVQILTEYGRNLGTINAASSHLQFDTNPFRNMPIGRYIGIDLDTDAPSPNDPGQAIRLCKQVSAVVASLSPCWFPSTSSGIPSHWEDCLFPLQMKVSPHFVTKFKVVFVERLRRSWRTNGKLNKSLNDYDEGWYDERLPYTRYSNTDVGLVLQIMEQLRSVLVFIDRPVPEIPRDEHLIRLVSRVEVLAHLETPFGLYWRKRVLKPERLRKFLYPNPDSGDHVILAKIHSLQIWHEYLLDDLPGRSANLLRQERFLNWCGAYERQHGKALYGIPARLISEDDRLPERRGLPIAIAHDWIDFDLWELIKYSFHSRF